MNKKWEIWGFGFTEKVLHHKLACVADKLGPRDLAILNSQGNPKIVRNSGSSKYPIELLKGKSKRNGFEFEFTEFESARTNCNAMSVAFDLDRK